MTLEEFMAEDHVAAWFVSTVERLPGNLNLVFIETMKEFETEAAAKRYAMDALAAGLRVEAGTLRAPQVRIHGREAAAWAASAEAASLPLCNPPQEVPRSRTAGDSGSAPWRI